MDYELGKLYRVVAIHPGSHCRGYDPPLVGQVIKLLDVKSNPNRECDLFHIQIQSGRPRIMDRVWRLTLEPYIDVDEEELAAWCEYDQQEDDQ